MDKRTKGKIIQTIREVYTDMNEGIAPKRKYDPCYEGAKDMILILFGEKKGINILE